MLSDKHKEGTQNKKILFPFVTFYKSGGMRVLCKLANELSRAGYTVIIVVADDSLPYFPVNPSVNIFNMQKKNSITALWAMSSFIRKHPEYNVIANQYRTAYYLFWGTLFNHFNIQKIYYIQAYEAGFYMGKSISARIHRVNAWFSYFLPFKQIVNSDLYADYKNIHTNRILYPGLDLNTYYPKDVNFFNKTIKIGTIGRKEVIKGTSDVCKAMEILQTDGFIFDFYIAFNDFETCEHHFVKPDGDDYLAAFYRDMDIVVAACKGQHGAIHYPIIESMSVGTSVVCTDYYPANEKNAYIVDESSPEQIVSAVKEIIHDKLSAIEKRKQALEDIRQFSWPIIVKKFISYMQEEC